MRDHQTRRVDAAGGEQLPLPPREVLAGLGEHQRAQIGVPVQRGAPAPEVAELVGQRVAEVAADVGVEQVRRPVEGRGRRLGPADEARRPLREGHVAQPSLERVAIALRQHEPVAVRRLAAQAGHAAVLAQRHRRGVVLAGQVDGAARPQGASRGEAQPRDRRQRATRRRPCSQEAHRRPPRAPWPACRPCSSRAASRHGRAGRSSRRRGRRGRARGSRGGRAPASEARRPPGARRPRRPPSRSSGREESGTRTARLPPRRTWWSRTGHLLAVPLPAATSRTRSQGRPAARARWTASIPASTSRTVISRVGKGLGQAVEEARPLAADDQRHRGGAHARQALARDLDRLQSAGRLPGRLPGRFLGHASQPRERSSRRRLTPCGRRPGQECARWVPPTSPTSSP